MTRHHIVAAVGAVVFVAAVFQAGPRASNDSVAVLVVLRQQATLPSLPATSRATRRAAVEEALRRAATRAQRPVLQLLAKRQAEGAASAVTSLWVTNAIAARVTNAVARELEARPDVLEVRPVRTLDVSRSLAAGAPEPNVSHVGATALWDLGYRGQGVVVASMDTGVDVSHPDLAGAWRGGANSWYDPNGQHPTMPTDVHGHGTWTMGAMVGGDRGGTSIGVAPAATWIAVKIFNDQGAATTVGIHQGFQWLLDPDGNPTTDDAPDVVENSWTMGAAGCDLEFQLDLRSLRAAGILPVFAAGNGGPASSTSFSPANNPEALAAGDTDNADVLDPKSSRGPSACGGGTFPELVAPGVDIRTTDLYGGYVTETGTSMAAPHVAGTLALLLSAFPNLSADRQESSLRNGAVDLGAAGPDDDTGYGRLDALASYNWLATAPDFDVSAAPAAAPTAPGGSVSYTVAVSAFNGFSDDVALSVTGLDAAQATSTLAPATIAGSGSSQLTLTTAASLAPGSYPLTITATSGTTTRRAVVELDVSPPPDFSISGSPSSATTVAGGNVSYTVGIAPVNAFNAAVTLSLSGLTTSQASWSFSPAAVSGSGTSTLTITTAASLAPATYPLTIRGTAGTTAHSVAVSLVVAPTPDFTLSATPTTVSTLPGGSVSASVTVGAKNGFAGTVALALSGLSPSQASWTLTPSSIDAPGTAKLALTTASTLAPGSYRITITGTSGALRHTASLTLIVSAPPDFTVTINPTSTAVYAGGTASYTVSIGSKGGFAGNVSLSVAGLPSGMTGSFTPNPVATPGSSTLRVQTTTQSLRGTFSLRITGSSGALSHQVNATLTVR